MSRAELLTPRSATPRDWEWSLCQTPHRHYKAGLPGRKPSWNGAAKQRIVSVTTVLDGGQDTLTDWAARQGVAAGEMVARRWLGADAALDGSLLAFGELAALQPEHPHTYRDHKAALGTALHGYLADRLLFSSASPDVLGADLPFGLRAAVDAFVRCEEPFAVRSSKGLHVERTVGDYERAVAGTYDAQVRAPGVGRMPEGVHRLDAKTSNMLQPKHWAQVAEYERCAILCGEEPSDYLTIVHLTPMGEYRTYSIATGSAEHRMAQAVFNSALNIYRSLPVLGKLLKQED